MQVEKLTGKNLFLTGQKPNIAILVMTLNPTNTALTFKPTLEIPIGGELFHTNVIFDYLDGSSSLAIGDSEEINYGYLNIGLASSLLVLTR